MSLILGHQRGHIRVSMFIYIYFFFSFQSIYTPRIDDINVISAKSVYKFIHYFITVVMHLALG